MYRHHSDTGHPYTPLRSSRLNPDASVNGNLALTLLPGPTTDNHHDQNQLEQNQLAMQPATAIAATPHRRTARAGLPLGMVHRGTVSMPTSPVLGQMASLAPTAEELLASGSAWYSPLIAQGGLHHSSWQKGHHAFPATVSPHDLKTPTSATVTPGWLDDPFAQAATLPSEAEDNAQDLWVDPIEQRSQPKLGTSSLARTATASSRPSAPLKSQKGTNAVHRSSSAEPPGTAARLPHHQPADHSGPHTPQHPELGPGGRRKRVQVRVACTHCQKACKKCSSTRPCERCVEYGLSDCVDSSRKPRKTGVKRGPYKRRSDNPPGGAKASRPDEQLYKSEIALQATHPQQTFASGLSSDPWQRSTNSSNVLQPIPVAYGQDLATTRHGLEQGLPPFPRTTLRREGPQVQAVASSRRDSYPFHSIEEGRMILEQAHSDDLVGQPTSALAKALSTAMSAPQYHWEGGERLPISTNSITHLTPLANPKLEFGAVGTHAGLPTQVQALPQPNHADAFPFSLRGDSDPFSRAVSPIMRRHWTGGSNLNNANSQKPPTSQTAWLGGYTATDPSASHHVAVSAENLPSRIRKPSLRTLMSVSVGSSRATSPASPGDRLPSAVMGVDTIDRPR
ncbi:hypothetical protein IAU60_006816 [Kwoniella sp. DSM 27419]